MGCGPYYCPKCATPVAFKRILTYAEAAYVCGRGIHFIRREIRLGRLRYRLAVRSIKRVERVIDALDLDKFIAISHPLPEDLTPNETDPSRRVAYKIHQRISKQRKQAGAGVSRKWARVRAERAAAALLEAGKQTNKGEVSEVTRFGSRSPASYQGVPEERSEEIPAWDQSDEPIEHTSNKPLDPADTPPDAQGRPVR